MDWVAVFDVDGTMVDNRRYHEAAWIELGRRRGLGITPEFYRERIHSRNNTEIAKLLFGDDVGQDKIWDVSDSKESIYRDLFRPELKEIPGLRALLEALDSAGIACGVISNSPPENVDMVIDGLGIRGFFREIIDYTQVERGKPAPDLILESARRLGVTVDRTIVLEDSVSGFTACEAAGCPYIVVTAGADPDELVHARHPAAIVSDFRELDLHRMSELAGAYRR